MLILNGFRGRNGQPSPLQRLGDAGIVTPPGPFTKITGNYGCLFFYAKKEDTYEKS